MIVSIHQPHFLPWLGYFNKLYHSDVFVFLNTVQYRPRYYQNKCKIKMNDKELPLSIPVHADRSTLIDQVLMVEDENWMERFIRSIEQSYKRTPYFSECWPLLRDELLKPEKSLEMLNYKTILVLLKILNMGHVKISYASRLPVNTTNPTQRLVEICKHFGATEYISGRGGKDYMEVEQFEKSNINVIYQDVNFNQIEYRQTGNKFIPGLSVIDCIFNIGPVGTRGLIEKTWSPASIMPDPSNSSTARQN